MRYTIHKCKHFGICGGCRFRDVSYAKQLKVKQRSITKALATLPHPAIQPIIPSPLVDYYRNKMEYACGVWDDKLVLGLRERKKFYHIIDVKECYLQSPVSDRIRSVVRKAALKKKIKAFHRKKLTGVLRYLVIREGKKTGEVMVNLITSPVNKNKLKPIFDAIHKVSPEIRTLVWSVTDSSSDVAVGKHMETVWGRGYIEEQVGSCRFKISPYSFFQTNTRGTEVMYRIIKQCVRKAPKDLLLDIYSGAGCIGLYLASLYKMVIGLESNVSACQDARVNMKLNNIHNYQIINTKAEDIWWQKTTFSYTNVTAVVDPPRPGLSSPLIDFLCDKKPLVLLYISCNPDALKRDLQRLTQYYKITKIQPIDLFPHTPHIETVVVLKSRK